MTTAPFEIDDEFDHYMPNVSEQCDKALEYVLKADGGATSPLIVWDEANLLIDGHRRYRICTRLGLPYRVERVSCVSREEAKRKMDMIQYSRRNLSDHDQAIQAKRTYGILTDAGMGKEEALSAIAEQDGQSTRTTRRKVQYGRAFEKLEEEWQDAIIKLKVPQKYVEKLADMNPRSRAPLYRLLLIEGPEVLKREFKVKKPSPRTASLPGDIDPSPYIPDVLDDQEKDPELVGQPKSERVGSLMDEADKALAASVRAAFKLFGVQGLNVPDCYWKKRLDASHKQLADVYKEVRIKHG